MERDDLEDDVESAEINLMDELAKLNLNDHDDSDGGEIAAAGKKVLSVDNPVFSKDHRSSKVGIQY